VAHRTPDVPGHRGGWGRNYSPRGPTTPRSHATGECVPRADEGVGMTFIGMGTVVNVLAILVGSGLGVLIGDRLPERTRTTVTDGLGLITLVIGALNIVSVTDPDFSAAAGAPLLVVLGAVVIGSIIGSLLKLEVRLESFGGILQRAFGRADGGGRQRFVSAFVDTSLLFCIGPLALLGSLNDGLGRGIDQLVLKSMLDGFASVAFAASMGWGVAASAISVGIVQGLATILGVLLGAFLAASMVASITATGGVLLLAVGMRLLRIRQIPVGDMLPALFVAPVLTLIVATIRG